MTGRVFLLAGLFCLIQSTLALAFIQETEDPTRGALEAELVTLDLEERMIEHRLINKTEEPLTAIGYNVVTLYRDGTREVGLTGFECIYSAYLPKPDPIPAIYGGGGAIWPGQTVSFRDHLPAKAGTDIVAAYIEPRLVITVNRKAIGDADLMRHIADDRRGFYEALTTWLPEFESTLLNIQFGDEPVAALDRLTQMVEGTSTHRGALSRPQQSAANVYQRSVGEDASSLLEVARKYPEATIRRLKRRIEIIHAQIIASQNSWELVELEQEEDGQ